MKQSFFTIILLSSFISMQSYAGGLYMGFDVGTGLYSATVFKNTTEYLSSGLSHKSRSKVQRSTPFVMGSNMGYSFADFIRLEVSYNKMMTSESTVGGDTIKRSASMAMLNFYYDFNMLSNPIIPFIGGGIGHGEIHMNSTQNYDSISIPKKGKSYGVYAGVGYSISNILLDVKYSYIMLPKSIKSKDYPATVTSAPMKKSLSMLNPFHSVVVGVKFFF